MKKVEDFILSTDAPKYWLIGEMWRKTPTPKIQDSQIPTL